MDYGMCQNCDEFHRGYCFCTGEPEKIIGEMIACEFYKENKVVPIIRINAHLDTKQLEELKNCIEKQMRSDKCVIVPYYCEILNPDCGSDMRGEKNDNKKSS